MNWINVNDRLPTETDFGFSEIVLVYNELEGIVLGQYDFDNQSWELANIDAHETGDEVTYWMPLPDKPTV
ncbi:DUF551 domain-containing protein [Olivibacter sp. 47]|uniref:DUF551 domain-containing protein n=1 Tax=Olivibacter sp. 47 TaxID=3056486 RepID=UPI0025A4799E|nr:DUF551 domain-containing protein [Olivibacter sp. 47]MDM8174806.1 DUF551 domain-containing protein [Olivibacter sp. 47]